MNELLHATLHNADNMVSVHQCSEIHDQRSACACKLPTDQKWRILSFVCEGDFSLLRVTDAANFISGLWLAGAGAAVRFYRAK